MLVNRECNFLIRLKFNLKKLKRIQQSLEKFYDIYFRFFSIAIANIINKRFII